MSKLHVLPGSPMDVPTALEQAKAYDFQDVFIVGYDHEGSLQYVSSKMERKDVLYLLERMKLMLLTA